MASGHGEQAGVAGVTNAGTRSLFTILPTVDVSDLLGKLRPQRPDEFRVSVRRPDDLVVFDVIFQNLKLSSGPPPKLVREDPNQPAYLVVEHPPQGFGEEAFLDETGPEVPQGPL